MGLQSLITNADKTFKVVLWGDSAINANREGYEEYMETLDESLLDLSAETLPTYLVFKKSPSYRGGELVRQSQMIMDGKKVKATTQYQVEKLRVCLVDVENSDMVALNYRKGKDGFAHKDIFEILQKANAIEDLIYIHDKQVESLVDVEDKVKKS